MANFLTRCGIAWLMLLTLATPVLAAEPLVKTALVIDAPRIEAEGVVWAGVTFTIPEHWHIYWQNPGDSGIPTTMAWTLPDGMTAGDIAWPTPERIETSGLVTYGYSNKVTLPVPLMSARGNIDGAVNVEAKWLVCNESCIPESATLEGRIPGSTAAAKNQLEMALTQAPQAVMDANAAYAVKDTHVLLGVTGATLLPPGARPITAATFLPLEDGIVTNTDAQTFSVNQDATALTLTLMRGSADLPENWHGVLVLTRDGHPSAYTLNVRREPASASIASSPEPAPKQNRSLLLLLGLAFLGGLILNVMPCVLPILALKALALTNKAAASRAAAARQGIAYTIGVVGSFLLIAGGMLALKASGESVGWGFQLQHSGFVALLAVIMLSVSANLLGLFELPILFGNRASALDDSHFLGSLLIGALAVLVATPCSAPFMATAIGATLPLTALDALLVFASLGLGMAAPFLLISLWPAARRAIPKPGKWMHRFKQILAIPMLVTAAWLLWVLVQLLNPGALTIKEGQATYSASALATLRAEGTPVLVDATARWCLSCKVNERLALSPESMRQFFREHRITWMVADWTGNDPEITDYLARFERNGVPLYVYYPPHGAPVVLPQVLTPAIVKNAIEGK